MQFCSVVLTHVRPILLAHMYDHFCAQPAVLISDIISLTICFLSSGCQFDCVSFLTAITRLSDCVSFLTAISPWCTRSSCRKILIQSSGARMAGACGSALRTRGQGSPKKGVSSGRSYRLGMRGTCCGGSERARPCGWDYVGILMSTKRLLCCRFWLNIAAGKR